MAPNKRRFLDNAIEQVHRALHLPLIQAIHLALIQRFAALALAARKVDEGDLAHLHGTAGV